MPNYEEAIETLNELIQEIKELKDQLHLQRKPLYTNQEMIEMMSVSSATLKKWRNAGQLGYTQIGSTYFYSQDDINEFMSKNHNEAYAYH